VDRTRGGRPPANGREARRHVIRTRVTCDGYDTVRAVMDEYAVDEATAVRMLLAWGSTRAPRR
jgi:hypothetical protein